MGNFTLEIPYTAKLSRFLRFFLPIVKVFPLNHLPCTVHNGMGLMHRESFPVNSVFCAQPQKFSPSKVLPYTVLACWFGLILVVRQLFIKPLKYLMWKIFEGNIWRITTDKTNNEEYFGT